MIFIKSLQKLLPFRKTDKKILKNVEPTNRSGFKETSITNWLHHTGKSKALSAIGPRKQCNNRYPSHS